MISRIKISPTPWCRGIFILRRRNGLYGQSENNGRLLTIAVHDTVEGDSLRSIEKLISLDNLHRYTVLAGKMLAKIHTIQTKKFGKLNGKGEGYYKTLHEALSEPLESREDIEKACKQTTIDFQSVRSLIEEYKEIILKIRPIKPKLLHCDFGLDHIFVKSDEISGIIDFGDCASGDPVMDIVRWTYFSKPNYQIELLLRGYETVTSITENYHKRKRTYLIFLNLTHLLYYFWDNNIAGLAHVKKKLTEL